jgi:hypothetical protein
MFPQLRPIGATSGQHVHDINASLDKTNKIVRPKVKAVVLIKTLLINVDAYERAEWRLPKA